MHLLGTTLPVLDQTSRFSCMTERLETLLQRLRIALIKAVLCVTSFSMLVSLASHKIFNVDGLFMEP